jgi:3-deoxy-D-manno-octulosonic-acid transferase
LLAVSSEWIEVLYTPLDFWPVMRRAFDVIRPRRIVLVEAEVWPNLTALAQRRKVPIALVNARLSPRSEKRFRQFRWFVRPYFQKLDLICVPEQEDVGRWQSLGVTPDRIERVGSIKFDPEDAKPCPEIPRAILGTLGVGPDPPDSPRRQHAPGRRRNSGASLSRTPPPISGLFLLVAPRHVERTREIANQLRNLGLSSVRRSEPATGSATDCLLLDTTGELRNWYCVGTIVFIGKA